MQTPFSHNSSEGSDDGEMEIKLLLLVVSTKCLQSVHIEEMVDLFSLDIISAIGIIE